MHESGLGVKGKSGGKIAHNHSEREREREREGGEREREREKYMKQR